MSETNKSKTPYASLGHQLKRMRVNRRESLAEVSGAVEIDIDTLHIIEQGAARPNEEILLLLISHFSIKDEEADLLWKLADYDTEPEPKPVAVMSAEDLRIVYTDLLHVTVNDAGVVMNFMQNGGSQPLAIARVGMSREHALKVLEVLQKTLIVSQQSALPAPKPPTVESQE
jgi:transcriptional regulator with XRE-family HTH domain